MNKGRQSNARNISDINQGREGAHKLPRNLHYLPLVCWDHSKLPYKYFNIYNQFDATTSCYLCSKANPKHSLGSISEGDNEGLYVAYLGKQL